MQKNLKKISENEIYEEIVDELRSRLKSRKDFIELANIILEEEISEKDIDWKNL